MHTCPFCGGPVSPCDQRIVVVATDTQLRSTRYVADVKEGMRRLGLPRRRWRDAIADALCAFDGTFLYPDGRLYIPPEIDDVFPEGEDQKWISVFARGSKGRPARLHTRTLVHRPARKIHM